MGLVVLGRDRDAQVEAGKFNLDRRPVDLRSIVAASAESARPAAATQQVQLVVSVGTRELVVTGDAVRLGQACHNLLSNASKFPPAGGRVTVAHWTPTGTPTVQRPIGRCCR